MDTDSTFDDLIKRSESVLLDSLVGILKKLQKLSDQELQEFRFPTSLSPSQLAFVVNLLSKNGIDAKLKWFFPISTVQLQKNRLAVFSQAKINFTLPPFIKEQLVKLSMFKTKKNPYYRNNDQFRSNFTILTYFNTQPIVPKMIKRGDDFHSRRMVDHSMEIENFLNEIHCENQIQVISGLSKEDKLELIIMLNNRCAESNKACRIVYLQCLSILTFWMALKVKEICKDHWNFIGYQITLESKTSPNNSIIFFEMATFIRALNRDLEMNLITHLIIDIDQNHLFFNLLLLYLKENIDSLKHLQIFILTQNKSQSVNMIEYFKPETIVNFKNFAESQFVTSYTVGNNVKQLFLEDLVPAGFKEKFDLPTAYNADIEHLLIKCWFGKESLTKLVEYLSMFPMWINYQCNQLCGITPLIVGVVRGSTHNVYQILTLGADCHVTPWNHMLPIEWAVMYRREETFQLLFTHHYSTNQSFDLNLPLYYSKKLLLSSSLQPNKCIESGNLNKCHNPPLYYVNYDLILHLLPDMIRQIYYSQPNCSMAPLTSLGSILILLPSYNSVSTLRKLIITELSDFEYEFTIFCLYPHVPNNELDVGIGILSLSTNQVRVILSTFNVDSVFLNDIYFVINTGVRLEKVQSAFSSVNMHRLISNQAISPYFESHYNSLLNQNSTVVFYNLFSKQDSLNLLVDPSDSMINLSTDSMYHCIFAAKCFKFRSNKISNLFGQMICQPKKDIIINALKYLKNINVFDDNEELTELGKILIDLSIEPHYAKMIIYSVILRCLDPILTIVCALSSPNSLKLCTDDAGQREQDFANLNILSHKSYSDHLIFVYAFQKWQELCRSNAKNNGKVDKKDIILSSSFEMIYSLRTKILGQLRAIGFVKGKGSMNIRQLNINSDNFSLVKAAICAGQPIDHFAQLIPNQAFSATAMGESIYIHPNSILSFYLKDASSNRIPSNLVLFDRKFTCGNISYIQNCTLINPLTLAIFADECKYGMVSFKNNCLDLGNQFQFTGEDIGKVYQIRQRWQQFAKKRLMNMQLSISEEENVIIRDLIRLITTSDDYMGFGAHTNIGRAPQVMSTYFCSTVRVKSSVQQQ